MLSSDSSLDSSGSSDSEAARVSSTEVSVSSIVVSFTTAAELSSATVVSSFCVLSAHADNKRTELKSSEPFSNDFDIFI